MTIALCYSVYVCLYALAYISVIAKKAKKRVSVFVWFKNVYMLCDSVYMLCDSVDSSKRHKPLHRRQKQAPQSLSRYVFRFFLSGLVSVLLLYDLFQFLATFFITNSWEFFFSRKVKLCENSSGKFRGPEVCFGSISSKGAYLPAITLLQPKHACHVLWALTADFSVVLLNIL